MSKPLSVCSKSEIIFCGFSSNSDYVAARIRLSRAWILFHFQIKALSSLARLRLLNILFVCLRRLNPLRLDFIFDLKLVLVAAAGIALCTQPAEAAQSPATSLVQRQPVSVSEDPVTWRRDPFIGAVKKGGGVTVAGGIPLKPGAVFQKQEHDIRLQGIMQVDKAFHALINGRSVRSGDTIAGVTIREISRHQVVVLNDRKEKIIYDIYQGRIDRGKQ